MTKKLCWQDEVVELTIKIMREHYKRNLAYVLSFIAEDIFWIGPLECQFVFGKEEFSRLLQSEQTVPISVSDMEFWMVNREAHSCVVAGRLLASTLSKSPLLLSVWQRYTFCWKEINETPQIVHIHASNPWEYVRKDETFPFSAGKLTYEYMEKMCRQKQRKRSFLDTAQNEIFLDENQIIYVEARKKNCIIYYTEGTFEVCMGISFMQKQLTPSQFYRIHRGFLVNIHYIVSVQRYELMLCGQIRIPIPEKRYRKIKEEIHELEQSLKVF